MPGGALGGLQEVVRVQHMPEGVRAGDRAFLERLIAGVSTDERVSALFLGGSHASGTADEHSDLDLYLVTTDEGFDSFRDGRHELMRGLGDVVFLEEHEDFGFLMLLYMYSNGVHGEMAVAPARDIAAIHGGPHMTLLDKDGLVGGRQFPAWRLDADERRGVTWRLLVWFWYDRRLLDVALARGRLWTAHYYLERCRQACVSLAQLDARPDAWPSGYEKSEGIVDTSTLARLAATVVALEPAAMRRAAAAVTQIYLDIGRHVAPLQGVDFPDRLVDTVIGGLDSGA